MATGYEDYVVHMYTNPRLALDRCSQHLVKLMEKQGARTGADWVTYDPSTLDKAIEQARKDQLYLSNVVMQVGVPRAIPTRRFDPGPVVGFPSY